MPINVTDYCPGFLDDGFDSFYVNTHVYPDPAPFLHGPHSGYGPWYSIRMRI